MCLTLRSRSKQPYKTGWTEKNIRYKVIEVIGGRYRAPYMYTFYNKKKWNKAISLENGDDNRLSCFGFHVFVNKDAAIDFCSYLEHKHAVCEIEVKGFLRSGSWNSRCSETYKQIKFKSIIFRGPF